VRKYLIHPIVAMNIFKNFTTPSRRREASGPLTGRILAVGQYAQGLKVEEVIGEGGFATIYRVIDIVSGAVYALKHCVLNGNPEFERDVHTEIAVMKALAKCPETLKLKAADISHDGEALLLLEFCEETLAAHILSRSSTGLTNSEVISIFLPVARAVCEMHSRLTPPMAHRDIKAENILRRPNGSWVLCDFGSAVAEQKVYSNGAEISKEEERIQKQTTPAYRAPELWDLYAKEFIGLAVDIWSLGCLLYLLAYNKLPFDGEAKLQILNGSYQMRPGRPSCLEDLISSMLQVNPKDRPNAKQVVQSAEALFQNGGQPAGRKTAELTFAEDWGEEFVRVARQRSVDQNQNQNVSQQPQIISAQAPIPGVSSADEIKQEDWATFPVPAPAPAPKAQGTNIATSTTNPSSEIRLREHCKVLEQVLDTRNKDVDLLRKQRAELENKVKRLEELEKTYKQHISDLEARLAIRDDKDTNGIDSGRCLNRQTVAQEIKRDININSNRIDNYAHDTASHNRSRSSELDLKSNSMKTNTQARAQQRSPMKSSSSLENSSMVHATRAGIVEPKETFFSDLDPLG
jgi:serine/threonine protein kinase